MIAYSSPFIPVEWIAAHGLKPRWLRPRSGGEQSISVATRGVCPYAGALLDTLIAEGGDSAFVLTTICDQMRYAAAMAESKGRCPVFLLNVPSTWQTDEVRELYLDELRRFGRFMEGLGGKSPSKVKLTEVMREYERARQSLVDKRDTFSARQFADELAQLRGGASRTLRSQAEPGNEVRSSKGMPLAVVGGTVLEDDMVFFDFLENAGGRVVLDATEAGERTLPRKFDAERLAADPLRELADAYFTAIPDVFRRPNSGFYDWLGRELAERRVRGIVFRRYVWCDLWHAELQRLKQWSPVPVLDLDAGADDASAAGRTEGRIESFLEMLR
jgi:benzoyl-CoA reductase/2-hydroxyglutaryl-CoA dehydratase subunit BcrC/BadD/HgdB